MLNLEHLIISMMELTCEYFYLTPLNLSLFFTFQVKDCVTVHFVSDYHQVYELAFPPREEETIVPNISDLLIHAATIAPEVTEKSHC